MTSIFLNSLKGGVVKSINCNAHVLPCHASKKKAKAKPINLLFFWESTNIHVFQINSFLYWKNVIEMKIGKQLPLLTEQFGEQMVRHASLKTYIAFILQLVLHGKVSLLCSALLEFLLLSSILEIMGSAKAMNLLSEL